MSTRVIWQASEMGEGGVELASFLEESDAIDFVRDINENERRYIGHGVQVVRSISVNGRIAV